MSWQRHRYCSNVKSAIDIRGATRESSRHSCGDCVTMASQSQNWPCKPTFTGVTEFFYPLLPFHAVQLYSWQIFQTLAVWQMTASCDDKNNLPGDFDPIVTAVPMNQSLLSLAIYKLGPYLVGISCWFLADNYTSWHTNVTNLQPYRGGYYHQRLENVQWFID